MSDKPVDDEEPFTPVQPKDGDRVLHCGHLNIKPHHFWSAPTPMAFTRPDGSVGTAHWVVACDNCARKANWDPAGMDIRADSTWVGDEPAVRENPGCGVMSEQPDFRIEDEDAAEVGRNEQWVFGVGRLADRWVGFARARTEAYLHLFPQIAEGFLMGLTDRDRAVRMVGALAQDEWGGFGGVEVWAVPEELRGKAEDFRCPECGEVCCPGDHDEPPYEDLEP